MHHTELLQALIDSFGYDSYLEIGVEDGKNFNALTLPESAIKVGIDPAKKSRRVATHRMTSDEYFAKNPYQTFDLIFIDGLHEAEQVLRDVNHALTVLNDGGTIVCHDLNPQSYQRQVVPRVKASGAWLGDCWKAWVSLRRRANLSMFVVDTDYGCGVIRRRHALSSIGPSPLPLTSAPLTLDFRGLRANREAWLNLVPVSAFQDWMTQVGKHSFSFTTSTLTSASTATSTSTTKSDVSSNSSSNIQPEKESTPDKKDEPPTLKTSNDIIDSVNESVNQSKLQPQIPIPMTRKNRRRRGKYTSGG